MSRSPIGSIQELCCTRKQTEKNEAHTESINIGPEFTLILNVTLNTSGHYDYGACSPISSKYIWPEPPGAAVPDAVPRPMAILSTSVKLIP